MPSCVTPLFFLVLLCSSITSVDPVSLSAGLSSSSKHHRHSMNNNPNGVKVRLTNGARNMMADLGRALMQTVVDQPLGDFLIGLKYAGCVLSGLTIIHLNPGDFGVHFQQNVGLLFVTRNMEFTATFEQNVVLCTSIPSGRTTARGRGINLTVDVRLRRNQGRLNVEMTNCEATLGEITFESQGRAASALNSIAKGYLTHINNKICSTIQTSALPLVNNMLGTLTMVHNLHKDRDINFDYSLTKDVKVNADSLDVTFRGRVFWQGEQAPVDDNLGGGEIVIPEGGLMAYVGISDVLLKSAAQAVFRSGPFELDVPEINWIANDVLRKLKLPEGPVRVELTEAPAVSISPTGVSVKVHALAQSLVPPEKPALPVNCDLTLKTNLDGARLILDSQKPNCKIKPQTTAGKIVKPLINFVKKRRMKEFIKSWFEEGVMIPLPAGIVFTQSSINYQDGFMVAGGNLHLNEPEFMQWLMNRNERTYGSS